MAVAPIKTKLTKSGLMAYLADYTEFTKGECAQVIEGLEQAIMASIGPKGCGEFTIPGVLKVKTRVVPATKGGKKATNPFNGETYITKAKPASVKLRILPLAKLKEAANAKK